MYDADELCRCLLLSYGSLVVAAMVVVVVVVVSAVGWLSVEVDECVVDGVVVFIPFT